MQADCAITQTMKRAQITVFAQAAKLGITHKVIHYDTGMSLSAIGQYARGETAMGGPCLIKLIGVIPDDLLSLLLPDGRLIVKAPVHVDHDEVIGAMTDYFAEKQRAHHPESECGREIGPIEHTTLCAKLAVVVGGKAA